MEPALRGKANTEWTMFQGMTRIPESQAPNVRNGNLWAEIKAEVLLDPTHRALPTRALHQCRPNVYIDYGTS